MSELDSVLAEAIEGLSMQEVTTKSPPLPTCTASRA
jgi:hypothetical protein